jgi:hypothetical protein
LLPFPRFAGWAFTNLFWVGAGNPWVPASLVDNGVQ